MLIIEYDPESGEAVPDGQTEKTIKGWYFESMAMFHFKNESLRFVAGTENLIHAARVLIKRGFIPIDEIEFRFQGKQVKCNETGVIADWPAGFCDTVMNFVTEILAPKNWSKK